MKFQINSIDDGNINPDLNLGPTDVAVFIGANGSGKSKLGHHIEKLVYSQTLEAKNKILQIDHQIAELDHRVNEEKSRVENIVNTDLEKIRIVALGHNEEVVAHGPNGSLRRSDFLKIFFSGGLSGNVEIKNYSGSVFPPQSIEDLDENSIFSINGIEIDLILINANYEDFEKLKNIKSKLIARHENNLKIQLESRDLLTIERSSIDQKINDQTTLLDHSYRICAQRNLMLNEHAMNVKDFTVAENELLYSSSSRINDTSQKWGNRATNGIQSDFEKLITLLISEEAEKGALYRQSNSSEKPATKIDVLINIWRELMPHRSIAINGLKVHAENKGQKYSLIELSDGERAIIYIIGQCLAAPERSLIILDEPDVHLHSSILISLFDSIQSHRMDCAFLYITHNIEFAQSRLTNHKYVISAYEHLDKWNIEKIEVEDDIPEDVTTKILGSRKEILFVEGGAKSWDLNLYQKIYKNFTVMPRGSCDDVRKITTGIAAGSRFTRVKAYGLCDKDSFNEHEIAEFQKKNIYFLPVAQIENLFFIPEVVEKINSITGGIKEYDKNDYINSFLDYNEKYKDWIVKSVMKEYIYKTERLIQKQKKTFIEFEKFSNEFEPIGLNDLLLIFEKKVEGAIKLSRESNDLTPYLEIFRSKSGFSFLQTYFGFNESRLNDLIRKKIDELVPCLEKYLPKFESMPDCKKSV